MKIIKHGRKPTNVFRGACKHCGSVIEASRPELAIEWDQRENGEFGRARCPVCPDGAQYEMVFYPKDGGRSVLDR